MHKFKNEIICAFILVVMTHLFGVTGIASKIDNILYDVGQNAWPRTVPDDLIVVAIDENSLDTLGRWPWNRRTHAQVIKNLHADGARAIGLDLLFSERQRDDPEADRLLGQAIADAGNVVLPLVFENKRSHGQLIESMPIPELAEVAASMGFVHAEVDDDNVARSIYLWSGLGQPVWPHFVHALLKTAGQRPTTVPESLAKEVQGSSWSLVKFDQRYVNFSSARYDFQTISYEQVLRGAYAAGTFRGKTVLIGATASGLSDQYPTPVSGMRSPMPGVIFLANALVSLRDSTLITRTKSVAFPVWCCLLVLIPLLWIPHANPMSSLGCNVALVLGLVGLYLTSLWVLHLWIPVGAVLLGLFASYPVWAWLKLRAASRALDVEISKLREELSQWGAEIQGLRKADPVEDRLIQIRTAIEKLALFKDERVKTLEFISHDIRVPLASAMVQVGHALGKNSPAYGLLSNALDWTEDFLHVSRLQIRGMAHFSEQDLGAILIEASDDVYPLILERGLQLTLDIPEEPIWIWGDPELLKRMLHNVLSNSIKYSTPHGPVTMRARVLGDTVDIAVTNRAEPMETDALEQLFQRYVQSPLHADDPSAQKKSGVGLGLFFVRTVVEKHGGSVRLQHQGQAFSVQVSLPIQPH